MMNRLFACLLLISCTGCALHRSHYYVDPDDGRVWFQAKYQGQKQIWVFYGDHFVKESMWPSKK